MVHHPSGKPRGNAVCPLICRWPMVIPRIFRLRWLRRALALGLGVLLGVGAAQMAGLAQAPAAWQVGTEPAFPPFEMRDDATGQLTGFDIELMQAIGEAAGREVQFISLPFDGLVPALQSRTIDAAISGMTITAERAQTIDFSRPYFRRGWRSLCAKPTPTSML